MKSVIRFADEKLKESFKKLKDSKTEDKEFSINLSIGKIAWKSKK